MLYQSANSFIRQATDHLDRLREVSRSNLLNEKVKAACGDHDIIDHVLMTVLIMVPGQNLPVHFDVPLFREIPKNSAPGM